MVLATRGLEQVGGTGLSGQVLAMSVGPDARRWAGCGLVGQCGQRLGACRAWANSSWASAIDSAFGLS